MWLLARVKPPHKPERNVIVWSAVENEDMLLHENIFIWMSSNGSSEICGLERTRNFTFMTATDSKSWDPSIYHDTPGPPLS